jgi:hypothetical protein
MIRMLTLVARNKCRRRRGAQLHATGSEDPIPEQGTCPHGRPLRTLWTPGYGPDSEPPEFEWDREGPI